MASLETRRIAFIYAPAYNFKAATRHDMLLGQPMKA
jgi:hypothetical protein